MPSAWDATPVDSVPAGQAVSAWDATPIAAPAKAQPTPQPLAWWERVGKGLGDIRDATEQMVVHAVPAPVVNALNSTLTPLNNAPIIGPITRAMGLTAPTAQQVDQSIAEREQEYQQRRAASEPQTLTGLVTGERQKPGIDWLRMLGSTAATAPLAAVMPASSGVLAGAAQGALYGGISSPVTDGGYESGKLKQMATGALIGGGTSAAADALARAISPKVSGEAKTLLDSGVTLTPGQIMGGALKRVEDAATSVPFLGDMVKNAQRRSFQDLNEAAINRALTPIGEKLPSGTTGREAIEYAGTKLSDAYENVLGKMGAIRPDAKFAQDIKTLSSLTQNLPQSTADQFERVVKNEVLGRIDANGVMTPQAMKAAESNLGSMARGYLRSQDYDTRQLGNAIAEAQATLRSMVQRVAPAKYAQELQSVNQGWANFMRPQRAAGMLGAEGGVFTPEQLQNAVKALDPSKNKAAFARGDALMQDLSEAAKTVMGNKVPDSGTPLRSALMTGAALAAGHSVPAVGQAAAPLAAVAGLSALPYTATGQKLAAALLTKRPAGAELAAEEIRALAPYLTPALVPLTK